METCVVTRDFVHRGTRWRRGSAIGLTEGELEDPFVAGHVRRDGRDGGSGAPEPRPKDGMTREGAPEPLSGDYFGNGREKPREEPPAKAAAGEAPDMTVAQLREALQRLGVPCPPNAKRGELAALYEGAKAAVAGSRE